MKRMLLPQLLIPSLLAGATQVSVPVRPQPECRDNQWRWEASEFRSFFIAGDAPGHEGHHYGGITVLEEVANGLEEYCPFPVGSRVWVPETWALAPKLAWASDVPRVACDDSRDGEAAYFKASFDRAGHPHWRSPATMPEWAARLRFTIEGVWVGRACDERYQGRQPVGRLIGEGMVATGDGSMTDRYIARWNAAYPDYPWGGNPWRYTYTLRRLE